MISLLSFIALPCNPLIWPCRLLILACRIWTIRRKENCRLVMEPTVSLGSHNRAYSHLTNQFLSIPWHDFGIRKTRSERERETKAWSRKYLISAEPHLAWRGKRRETQSSLIQEQTRTTKPTSTIEVAADGYAAWSISATTSCNFSQPVYITVLPSRMIH